MKEWFDEYVPDIIIIVLTLIIILGGIFRPPPQLPKSIEESKAKIENIQTKVDSIEVRKDSIIYKIKTVYEQINHYDTIYKEKFNSVVNYTADESYEFFINYINANRERLDSCINNGSQVCEFDICRTREVN